MKQLTSLVLTTIVLLFSLGVGAQSTEASKKSASDKIDFSTANPEDITNENFPEPTATMDMQNVEIRDVVKSISKMTGKNFILDRNVNGKITIISPTQVTKAEAYKAFLSALAMNGLTVVPSGKFLKIRQARPAQRDSIETYAGRYFPNTDQIITRIVKLKYISADEVVKQLRNLVSKEGDSTAYAPTNSLIITDFGSNIERIMSILNQLDVPGFEERLAVIRIRYAKAKDIADLVDQIINKGEPKAARSRFSSSRFRGKEQAKSGGAESFSLVIPDGRTNSIIVVGNEAGIQKIKELVAKLDFKLRPEDSGGVYVYYVRYGNAEKISKILGGIATESQKAQSKSDSGSSSKSTTPDAAATQAIFGGDVKVTADEDNNSLIVSASKQDYEVVKSILNKIDIPRDQVFVKAIIMEMNADNNVSWGVDYYKFVDGTNGVGRFGFRTGSAASLIDPSGDSGAILGFGSSDTTSITFGGQTLAVPSLLGLVKFLKSTVGANILSTPQIMALDNVEAEIEVGEEIPVGTSTATTGSTATTSIERKKATIKLKLTPYISPDSDSVRMAIEQNVAQRSKRSVAAKELAESSVVIDERSVKTEIVVDSGDTAVIGGLMKDFESESENKVPVLGDIPILGWLFKSKSVERTKSNLIIFITPKIVRNNEDSADILNGKLSERIQFIQRHLRGRDPYGETIDNLPRKASAAPISSDDNENGIEGMSPGDESIDIDNDEDESLPEEPAQESF